MVMLAVTSRFCGEINLRNMFYLQAWIKSPKVELKEKQWFNGRLSKELLTLKRSMKSTRIAY
jgi:hypothetical protein